MAAFSIFIFSLGDIHFTYSDHAWGKGVQVFQRHAPAAYLPSGTLTIGPESLEGPVEYKFFLKFLEAPAKVKRRGFGRPPLNYRALRPDELPARAVSPI